jgi:hypothetical protein
MNQIQGETIGILSDTSDGSQQKIGDSHQPLHDRRLCYIKLTQNLAILSGNMPKMTSEKMVASFLNLSREPLNCIIPELQYLILRAD